MYICLHYVVCVRFPEVSICLETLLMALHVWLECNVTVSGTNHYRIVGLKVRQFPEV